MSSDDQHASLLAVWEPLRRKGDDLPGLIQWDGTEQGHVTEMADRVRGLTSHLCGALELSSAGRYESALALIRVALEQMVVDWLVFRGQTFVQHFSNVDEVQWREWLIARDSGADWTRTIRSWNRTKKGDVRIVHEGLHSEPDGDGNRQLLSIYYFLLSEYLPSLGPPSAQKEDWATSEEESRQLADRNRHLWNVYLKWSSLLVNLKENQLVDEADAARLASHYRFLSGFAHPVVDNRRELYRKHAWRGWPDYDHFSSELVLLYAITLCTLEMRNFTAVLDQYPESSLVTSAELEQALHNADETTSYFWFLGVNPSKYDTWKAHNEAAFSLMKDGFRGDLPPEPRPDHIPYPADPLKRLIAIHRNGREMLTGLEYISPWPHQDASWR